MSVEMMMLQRFPIISAKLRKELIKNSYIRLLILDKKNDSVYCTACGKHYKPPRRDNFKHSEKRICRKCGTTCEVVSNHFTWNSLVRRKEYNLAVVIPDTDKRLVPEKRNCYISVVKISAHYVQDMSEPVINVVEHQRYIFTPDGRSLRYGRCPEWFCEGRRWYREMGDWKVMSKFTEPVFDTTHEERYDIYGLEQLSESCMKYSAADLIDLSGRYCNTVYLFD